MVARRHTAGDVFVRRLAHHGIDYLFANGGTDFAPVIEAFARGQAEDEKLPTPLVIPHETAAVAMAHGYYLMTGRPQAVMVHTNVGLANVVMGAINAAAEQIPMLICSGKTPVTETGHTGSRTTPINWGQDMRDQAALMRESVKWDAQLLYPEQIGELVDRGMAIAMSGPPGPVYLCLPREPLCAVVDEERIAGPVAMSPASLAPEPAAVAAAADILSCAERPVIIAHRIARPEDGAELQVFAEKYAIPVVEYWPSRISLSTDSPMHAGFEPGELLAAADAVLVLDALVPWLPDRHHLPAACKVIQVGLDPLQQRFPIRGFRSDVTLVSDVRAALAGLSAAMSGDDKTTETRFQQLKKRNEARRSAALAAASSAPSTPMTPEWVSYCITEALADSGVIFNELGIRLPAAKASKPGSFFGHSVAGGLGWAMPAALGAQLADRQRLVAACIGDGAYIFANPVACHQIAEALELPILTIIFNNGVWNAVRRSTLEIVPDDYAARANQMPITSLEPAPDYCKIAEASRAWTARVENGADLPAVLERAIDIIRNERRQVLLDVVVTAD